QKVICYYESWSSYNGYNPEDFDANLCTHVNYAFIGLWEDGNVRVEDDSLDIDQGLYNKVTGMKQRNPNLKVLLSVGGGSDGMAQLFAGIAADPAKRGALVGSASYFVSTYNFDGLDIDWEYPFEADRENYITLLRELRALCNDHGWLLTVAASADPSGYAYNIPQMVELLDWINVMTYDMYAAGNNWVNAGAPKAKLAMGVAFYGRSFKLSDANQHGLHAAYVGSGVGEGAPSYHEICESYGDWTRVWDDEQKNPYKYSIDQWIGYDDPDSIWIKAEYIKTNGFAGVMIWPIDGDDVHGKCGIAQVMLKHVNGALGRIDCC
ncbi:hypothetical protein NQ315_007163, partial [Exocentrus adspersus]